ncbi:nuclear transport factor 2 family protein [Streptomyces aureus]|uniref:nuclear transport factor 2 family protein n=1 Tax=Streptomyces aureus TaxID=193461 RepID=UPI000566D39E|nr:nuclear transport factor 2 family protein [Streptomyces aureus]
MVWIPQISDLVDRLGAAGLADALRDPAAATVPVALDDPEAGRISGVGVLEAWLAVQDTFRAERKAEIEEVATTFGEERAVGEWVVHLEGEDGARVGLPVAAAVDLASPLPVRIHHSRLPLGGRHVVRRPMVPPDPSARASDVVGAYLAALAAGDTAAVVAAFAPDGSFRGPSADAHPHTGTGELTALYDAFFAAGGGIPLTLCTLTEDGTRSAFEYVLDRWGGTGLPPQPGLAVCVRGADGLIASARVYDDVEAPVA